VESGPALNGTYLAENGVFEAVEWWRRASSRISSSWRRDLEKISSGGGEPLEPVTESKVVEEEKQITEERRAVRGY